MSPGPAPKQPSQRRRRNAPVGGEWIELPASVEKPILPPLPRGSWSARTRQTWDAWRRDPATAQYGPADVHYALDTIRLQEECAGGRHSLAGEIRLRMDGLGLTPKGKRNLRWRVAEPTEVVELPAGRSRRRRHLEAIR